MSALPQEADLPRRRGNVSSGPLPDLSRCSKRARKKLLDDLIGAGEQRGRRVEAERSGGLEVDDQFELGRLHHWKIGGLLALENPTDIDAYLTICIGKIGSVAHQATGRRELPKLINCGHCIVSYHSDELLASAEEEWVRRYDERPSSSLNDTCNGGFEVMFTAGMQDFQY